MERDPASTVWMVHAFTGMAGRKGTLSTGERGLTFRPEASRWSETEFPFADIKRARRVLGSPVLEIAISRQGVPPLVGFYFIKPPDLPGEEDTGFLRRRRVR